MFTFFLIYDIYKFCRIRHQYAIEMSNSYELESIIITRHFSLNENISTMAS